MKKEEKKLLAQLIGELQALRISLKSIKERSKIEKVELEKHNYLQLRMMVSVWEEYTIKEDLERNT